ncbi:PEP-CTERM sorting domain-containing protein [Umezakia ovalisporum]|jgi:hypothetical protein|uniref:PEP-CTERM sorting domain-containing protein n=2 Tax=Umezakia ovalisporum TaxID=75695 RepID=A0AA43H1L7_9CYAN|nr:PEP-CTERM sorting domain-containing protein [Umezakia ovalisporum]MBI1241950.1 PEP-CTERM sorting domain-containing protein [Nostoc sp. RI_552]MDH6058507.1 PEP-CTERM sorting domain-containing protein [Umezakia ovalisporum FSS-43]MDH6065088.1 PEP-CTERM sorting domain-containing protein [Umezakia ovalisporum FSS-62]MDH6067638.1 PEP-CTERM sorting domain-containing protein [Umezakia ovalisporum APH033B]MDH6069430.1 PEP-CTERM sorting domain-containing protein [Umezakia ovalisporum CobakiLakeA]
MEQYLRFFKPLLLLVTPVLASSVLVTSPSQAATFALSQGELVFTEFSQSPTNTFTDTNSNAIVVSDNGNVFTEADAIASFGGTPTEALNFSSSIAEGENTGYLGLAESETTIRGIFDIETDTLFSFDFTSDLSLATSVDNPGLESSTASGELLFALFDVNENTVLDSFKLAGDLTTNGQKNFIGYEQEGNVTLTNADTDYDFVGNQKFATGYADGYVQRYFSQPTTLALIQMKSNQVMVSTPEPTTIVSLLISTGLIGVAFRRKKI